MINCVNHKGEWVDVPKAKFRFRPSVYGLIKNGNKVCLCKNRSSGKYWFPGGGVEIGEGLKEALIREIDEEAGLQAVEIGEQIGVIENFYYYGPKDEAMHAFLFFYECHSPLHELKTNEQVQDDEAMDFEWMEIGKIKREDFTDMQDEIMAMFKKIS